MLRTLVVAALVGPGLAHADAALAATDVVAQHAQALAEKVKAKDEKPVAMAAELGFSTSTGNTETLHLNASIDLRWAFAADWLSTTRGLALFERSAPARDEPQIDTAASWSLQQRLDRYLSERFGVFAALGAERNPFAGLGSRYSGQLGISLLAITDKDAAREGLEIDHLAFDIGGYVAAEHNVIPPRTPPPPDPGDPDQIIAAARGAVDYVHRFAKGKEIGANLEPSRISWRSTTR